MTSCFFEINKSYLVNLFNISNYKYGENLLCGCYQIFFGESVTFTDQTATVSNKRVYRARSDKFIIQWICVFVNGNNRH